MDMANYGKKKTQNTVKLQRLGKNVFQIVAIRYDPDTAEELDPEIQQCTMDDIDRSIAEAQKNLTLLQTRLDHLNMLKTDMAALPVPGK